MKCYYIVIERTPGYRKTEEYFDYHANTIDEAWDYARQVARLCSSTARVKEVREVVIPIQQIEPHIYSPDYQAMGDCRVCGHGQDKPWHR
jgi:hypothetical protein